MHRKCTFFTLLVLFLGAGTTHATIGFTKTIEKIAQFPFELFGFGGTAFGNRYTDCPVCYPTVYEYCSEKLFHDFCCCSGINEAVPFQCQYADCSFLHANTCRDHSLITRCCCN